MPQLPPPTDESKREWRRAMERASHRGRSRCSGALLAVVLAMAGIAGVAATVALAVVLESMVRVRIRRGRRALVADLPHSRALSC